MSTPEASSVVVIYAGSSVILLRSR
ncbi:hypothetical protein CP061683_0467A, partial [Chlamydia psittaci 06-1683]